MYENGGLLLLLFLFFGINYYFILLHTNTFMKEKKTHRDSDHHFLTDPKMEWGAIRFYFFDLFKYISDGFGYVEMAARKFRRVKALPVCNV